MSYFDITKDVKIVKAGGLFCHACLVGKPSVEKSPDPRYCQGCNDFLSDEAKRVPVGQYPRWVPKTLADTPVKPQQPLPGLQQRVLRRVKTVKEKNTMVGRPPRVFNTAEMGILTDPDISVRKAGQLLGMNFMSVQHHRSKIKAGRQP